MIPHLYHGQMSGEVWLADQPTAQTPLWQLTESPGLVFHTPAAQMLAPTVEEEIVFGLENLGCPQVKSGFRWRIACSVRAGCAFQPAPQTLSGGEQQKLALAAIIARHPQCSSWTSRFPCWIPRAAFDLVALLAR